MNERESDPTGAFRGGAAGLEDDPRTGTEYERHAPDGAEPGGGQPNTGSTGDAGDAAERRTVVEGTAATSEIADPDAQANAERQGDGAPQPR
jgi:hypothetical protein